MEHWGNLSLQDLSEVVDGIHYKEEWKDLTYNKRGIQYCFKGKYQISNFGRVKSLGTHNSNCGKQIKIRKQCFNGCGYLMLTLNKNDKVVILLVHRAVGQNFILNPENKYTINHKMGIKSDNRFHQLEWATSSENGKHAFSLGLNHAPKAHLGKFGSAHPKSRSVGQYDINGILINTFPTVTEAKIKTGIKTIIFWCQNGRAWRDTYIFKYLT